MANTVGSANGTASVLFGNGNGTFQASLDYLAGSNPQALAVGDFNGDGRLDLAVANFTSSGDGTVSILLQSPTVSLSHAGLTFPDQVISTASSIQAVKLTNTGYLTLKIASIGTTGPNPADFIEGHTCGPTLAVSASCTINVSFKPNKIGPRPASITITDNAVGSPQSIPLRGAGVISGPNATLSAESLRFSPQLVGATSATQSIELTDYGTSALNVAIRTSGDFSETKTCGSSLAAGASCRISVSFKPSQQGTRSGTLSITDNAPGSPQTIALSGIGAVNTNVTLAPTSLSFFCFFTWFRGPHWNCSSPQTVSLTNVGSATLYITDITTGGLFSQTNNCGTSLGAKQSCSITVGERPPYRFCKDGTYTGAVAISDTGTDSPQKVALTEDVHCP
jgi:hypothetical protein